MARPKIHKKPAAKVNLSLPQDLKKRSARHAFQLGLSGGLSELVARLLVAELQTGQIALAHGRHLDPATLTGLAK